MVVAADGAAEVISSDSDSVQEVILFSSKGSLVQLLCRERQEKANVQ